MLVISRKTGEAILIGDEIEVVIIEAQNGKVKIGINADNSIRILRKEIVTEVTNENLKATASDKPDAIDKLGLLLTKGKEK